MKRLLSIIVSFCLLLAQVMPTWAEVGAFRAPELSEQMQNGVAGAMDREQTKVFLDAIAAWLKEMENEVNAAAGNTKQLLDEEEPLTKTDDEKKLDQQIVQALITIYDKGSGRDADLEDAIYSNRSKAYLTTLLPSMFSSLEQGTLLHANSFSFLEDQLTRGGYDACSEEGSTAAAVCENQLTAADALSGIWNQLTPAQKESGQLQQLIHRAVQGPYAASALQMSIPLVISGQKLGKIFSSETENMGTWDVVMQIASAFSLTNLLTATVPEDLWATDKNSSYYQREGFGNYFNAWTDLGRAWGFKALQNRNSPTAKELNKVVDQLMKGGGLYKKSHNGKSESIYATVKEIENNKNKNPGPLDVKLYAGSDMMCSGAAIMMNVSIDGGSYNYVGMDNVSLGQQEAAVCFNVADPLYPFIVGVFSTGYMPPGYEQKYLLAFLRRSYNRGQEYLGPKTATYMNNLIALGYYSLGGAVPKGVNGKNSNYTCQANASADTMCQRSSAPKDTIDRHAAFVGAHRVLSGLDLAMAAYGAFSLGKLLKSGYAGAKLAISLVKGTDKELKAVYGSWRYVRGAFKAVRKGNGADLYKKWIELDAKAQKALQNLANKADDMANSAEDAAKVAKNADEAGAVAQTPKKGQTTIQSEEGTQTTIKTDGNGNTRVKTDKSQKPQQSKSQKVQDKEMEYDQEGNPGKRQKHKEQQAQKKQQGIDENKVNQKAEEAQQQHAQNGGSPEAGGGVPGGGASAVGRQLPRVGAGISKLGKACRKLERGAAQIAYADRSSAAFDALARAGKINANGARGWQSIRGTYKVGIQDDVLTSLYTKGVTFEENGVQVRVTGAEMERAIRELQTHIVRGESELQGVLADRKMFDKCIRETYANDVPLTDSDPVDRATMFRTYYKEHLKMLDRGIQSDKLAWSAAESKCPGNPKYKIIDTPRGPKGILENEWVTYDKANTDALAREARLVSDSHPVPTVQASDIVSQPEKALDEGVRKGILAWVEKKLGRPLTPEEIERVRVRMTSMEIFKEGSDLQQFIPTQHIHYEVLLNDGRQFNYSVELKGVSATDMRGIFNNRSDTWNYFEQLDPGRMKNWLFTGRF